MAILFLWTGAWVIDPPTINDWEVGALAPLVGIVLQAMSELGVPGVAVGLLLDGHELTQGFGATNVNHPLPVDDNTLFQIGSISKTFVGTAAMRLVDRGDLDLDAPVQSYLPDFKLSDEAVAARVTLRHLFTHTGGWVGDFFEHTGFGTDALARIVARLADLPQLTPLGEVYTYSNSGFFVAGRVIEVVTGLTFERAIQSLVLDPLGLSMSFFRHFATEFIVHRVAAGHEVGPNGPAVVRPWARSRSAAPSGGIVSNLRDMLRYARFHVGDGSTPEGTVLLRPASMALMQSPLFPTDGMGGAVGITWMIGEVAGTKVVRHGGSTFGQRATLLLVPSRAFAIVVLTNADRGESLTGRVTRFALEYYLGLADRPLVPLARTTDELAQYAGRYVGTLGDVVATISDGQLILRPVPTGEEPGLADTMPATAGFIGDDRFVVLGDADDTRRGEFLRGGSGTIAWLRFQGRLHARQNSI
jgi:CubicO group peptidase (beta-lactamase class C family)